MIKHRNLTWDFVREMFEKLACISTLTPQVEKLARRLARWHANLKHWHTVWHVDTFFGETEKLTRFWYVGPQIRWYANHAGTQAPSNVDHVGM